MHNPSDSSDPNPSIPPVVWWVIWSGVGTGLIVVQQVFPAVESTGMPSIVRYIPFVPLGISVAVRWLVLPRIHVAAQALTVFIIGIALAEGSGIIGIVLGQETRHTMFQLALLGIGQFAPFWCGRFEK